ncbi:hypothetical protein [Haloglycomyces albus]|nr:hypothetical protein [Haloglycomyces albus]
MRRWTRAVLTLTALLGALILPHAIEAGDPVDVSSAGCWIWCDPD